MDVKKAQAITFKIIASSGSQRLSASQVLPGLKMALLEAGLHRDNATPCYHDRTSENTDVGTWFLEQVKS